MSRRSGKMKERCRHPSGGGRVQLTLHLEQRQELNWQRRLSADLCLFVALVGIALMIADTELRLDSGDGDSGGGGVDGVEITTATDTANRTGDNSSSSSSFDVVETSIQRLLSACVSTSTIVLLAAIIWYHVVDARLYMCYHSFDDWKLAVTPRRVVAVVVELVVCAVHPLSDDIFFVGVEEVSPTVARVDVYLSALMWLRLFLVVRSVVLHYQYRIDTSLYCLFGSLNRSSEFGAFYVVKSMMQRHPLTFLVALISTLLSAAVWTVRLCDEGPQLNGRLVNCSWLMISTFLTIGYGDVVPKSACGRGNDSDIIC